MLRPCPHQDYTNDDIIEATISYAQGMSDLLGNYQTIARRAAENISSNDDKAIGLVKMATYLVKASSKLLRLAVDGAGIMVEAELQGYDLRPALELFESETNRAASSDGDKGAGALK